MKILDLLTHVPTRVMVLQGRLWVRAEVRKYRDPTSKWWDPDAPGMPPAFWRSFCEYAVPFTGITNREHLLGEPGGTGLNSWCAVMFHRGLMTVDHLRSTEVILRDGHRLELTHPLAYFVYYRDALRFARRYNREAHREKLIKEAHPGVDPSDVIRFRP